MAGTLNLDKCLVVVSCYFLVHLHAKINSVIFSRESWPHSKRTEHLFFNKQVLFQTALYMGCSRASGMGWLVPVPILVGKTSVKHIYLFILPSSKVTLTWMDRVLLLKCVLLYILMCLSMVILQNLKVFLCFSVHFQYLRICYIALLAAWNLLFAARIIISLFYYCFLKQGEVSGGR